MTDLNEMEEDKPLDPKVEKIRRRMVRLLVISIGIMMIGLMSVLGAIVYKIGQAGDKATPSKNIAIDSNTIISKDIKLPNGASLLAASLDGNRILLRLKLSSGKQQLLIYNMQSAKVFATYNLDN